MKKRGRVANQRGLFDFSKKNKNIEELTFQCKFIRPLIKYNHMHYGRETGSFEDKLISPIGTFQNKFGSILRMVSYVIVMRPILVL